MGQQITRGKAARFFGSVFVAGFNPGDLCRGIYSVLQLL